MKARMDFRKASPQSAKAMSDLHVFVRKCGLEHALLELVKLSASQINGCAHCIDMHTKELRADGESEQRLYLLNAWRESPFYSERERAALAWTEAVTLVANGHVPDEVYEEARAQFSEEELANLTVAIVAINGVVGVTGPDFAYPSREYQIYTPLTFDPEELVNRMNYSYLAAARLKSGVSVQQAQAEMDVISAQITQEHPRENDGIGAIVAPMLEDSVATVRTALYVLLGAVLTMLLIGCANLANLLIARALVRQRELAVRAALGAGRLRLVTQSVAELVPMLVAGGAFGLIAAAWAVRTLVPMLPADVPRVENIGLQLPVVGVAVAILGAIAVFVGIWPAMEVSRQGLAATIGDLSRSSTSAPHRARTRDVLAVVQIAATLWLAIGAVLLTRSFAQLKRITPGFEAEGVYSVHLAIPRTKYQTDRAVAEFCTRVVERVRALPGVVSAAMVNRLPLAGGAQTWGVEFEDADRGRPRPGSDIQVDSRPITPDYFRTLQIPLLAGRTFTEADDDASPRVGIIDEVLAKRIFGDRSPIGRRFHPPMPARVMPDQGWYTIVGVVGHIRHERLEDDGRPQVYWSYKQFAQDRQALVVRTQTDPLRWRNRSRRPFVRSIRSNPSTTRARSTRSSIVRWPSAGCRRRFSEASPPSR